MVTSKSSPYSSSRRKQLQSVTIAWEQIVSHASFFFLKLLLIVGIPVNEEVICSHLTYFYW